MKILIADIADINELAQVEVESKLSSFAINEAYAIDREARLYQWQTYFAGRTPVSAKPPRKVFKAVEDNTIIGFIAVHLTTRHKDAEIQSFYVLKDQQRTGIGSKLLRHALEWLLEQEPKPQSLCVGIFPENPYQAFYMKYGGQYLNPHWIFWDNLEMLKNKLDHNLA